MDRLGSSGSGGLNSIKIPGEPLSKSQTPSPERSNQSSDIPSEEQKTFYENADGAKEIEAMSTAEGIDEENQSNRVPIFNTIIFKDYFSPDTKETNEPHPPIEEAETLFKAKLDSIKNNTSLKEIDLSWRKIGNEKAKALAEALEANTSLKEIKLNDNYISDEGAKALAEALKNHPSLQNIDLSWNKIGDMEALAEALKVNNSLQSLNLSWNKIGDMEALAEAIKTNTSLKSIDLSGCDIGDDGARALAEALKVNPSLLEIRLENNNIGPEGAKALAEALKVNTLLQKIKLNYNKIGPEGAKALAEALKEHPSLTSINLMKNNIGDEGAKALAEALEKNTSLKDIRFDLETLSTEAENVLISLLETNKSLNNIYIACEISNDRKSTLLRNFPKLVFSPYIPRSSLDEKSGPQPPIEEVKGKELRSSDETQSKPFCEYFLPYLNSCISFSNKDPYEETFVNYSENKITCFENGNYEGAINQEGQPHGQGIFKWQDGSIYEGEFKDGKPDGQGTLITWEDPVKEDEITYIRGSKQEGTFVNGETIVGKVQVIHIEWPDGSTYKGQFKDGKPPQPDGQGTYTWTDGRKYEGQFDNGKMHGEGKMTFPDGRMLTGTCNMGM